MVKVTWIAHSCFLVEAAGKNIYFDPYEIDNSYKNKPADVIFASHDHYDHFDDAAAKIILKADTQIICPASCISKVKTYKARGVKPGDKGQVGEIYYEAVPAYNINKKFHPKANNWCGYIVNIGGTRLYHAGDTDDISDFVQLKGKVDVALLPVGGTYTMDFNEAMNAVGKIQPKYVVPMHHWDKDLNTFKKLTEKTFPNIKVALLADGPLEI